jgi:hypothetical protein
MSLWQAGVTKVIMSDDHGTKLFDNDAQKRFDLFVKLTGIQIVKYTPNLNWIQEIDFKNLHIR